MVKTITEPRKKNQKFGVITILKAIALILAISIFLRGIIDIDVTYDTWGYHLPFAARIWHIVPAEQYINMEGRFAGFPLFVQFLQGFFWFITRRVQGANLVGWSSIALYVYFLKAYFRVPLFLSTIALLAIPLVQAHATSSYVDLASNIPLAISIMMTYLIYQQKQFPTLLQLLIIIFSTAAASNSKPQLEPLVLVVLFFVAVRFLWLRWRQPSEEAKGSYWQWLLKAGAIAFVASLFIFATPIKNIALFGNPFYPVRIEIAGHVLNHALPLYDHAPGYLGDAPRAQRWLYSILDIKAAPWSIDQWSEDVDRQRMGGFFGAYVVFHFLLFTYLCIRNRDRETTVAAILLGIMSIVAANFPQSHELRYFMYWMIVLVSLNLYLVTRIESSSARSPLINTRNLGLVCLVALTIVAAKTHFFYIKPFFHTLENFKQDTVDRTLLEKIEPNDRVCIVGKYPYTFIYTPWFHPEKDYTYSIQRGEKPSECTVNKKILS